MDELAKVLKLTHSLKNQLKVVEKTLGVYSEKLPKHRLTEIGINATKDAKFLVKEIDQNIKAVLPKNHINEEDNLSPWLEKILSNQKKWEEDFNLKILIPKNTRPHSASPSIDQVKFIKLLEKFMEQSAVSGASAIEITINIEDKLIISLYDNGQGNLSNEDPNINSIIEELQLIGVESKITSTQSIGASLISKIEC